MGEKTRLSTGYRRCQRFYLTVIH